MNRVLCIQKLKGEIKELKNIQEILSLKNPSYEFLDPTLNNSIGLMVDLLIYLEDKNPYFKGFSENLANHKQTAMHRVFFTDLHIATEEGLREIINNNQMIVIVNRNKLAEKIISDIKTKLKNTKLISKELERILKLAGNFPVFNDYLNSVLDEIESLDKKFKLSSRVYFDALSIIRNKVSHAEMKLSEEEKDKLRKAKFDKAIASDGNLQMTFEGYSLLLKDVIRFFDHLYANL